MIKKEMMVKAGILLLYAVSASLLGYAMVLVIPSMNAFLAAGILLMGTLIVGRYFALSIPPKYYAIFSLFGKRWRARSEGLTWWLPLAEKFVIYSKELDRLEVEAIAKSKDLLGIKMKGSVEFVVDPDREMLLRYDETRKNQKGAITDSIKDELGILAGTKNAADFVKKRRAITLIINCRLRLKEMPHENPAAFGSALKEIPLSKKLDFYDKYADKIQTLLDSEAKKPEERSRIEESYGIDILVFNLTDPDYTEKTNAAFEEAKQAQAKEKAAKAELNLAKEFESCSQKGINAAQVSVGKAKREVHSIEGKPVEINIGGNR